MTPVGRVDPGQRRIDLRPRQDALYKDDAPVAGPRRPAHEIIRNGALARTVELAVEMRDHEAGGPLRQERTPAAIALRPRGEKESAVAGRSQADRGRAHAERVEASLPDDLDRPLQPQQDQLGIG